VGDHYRQVPLKLILRAQGERWFTFDLFSFTGSSLAYVFMQQQAREGTRLVLLAGATVGEQENKL